MEKRLEFPYGREIFVSRTIIAALVGLVFAFLVAIMPSASPFVALTGAVVAAYIALFGVTPLLTKHWLTRSRIILRQGWYFRTILPFSEIASLQASDDAPLGRVPLGIHRPFNRPTLYVTGGRLGLVVIRLSTPRRFWQSFFLTATEIVFDVGDSRRFLAAYEERRRLLSPVEAERADA